MKNTIKNLLAVIVLMVLPIITTFAQPSPPAPSPSTGAAPTGSNTLGCSVPVGDGIWVLVALAVVYLSYRYWQVRNVEKVA